MSIFTLQPAVLADAATLARIHVAGRAAIPLPVIRALEEITAYHAQLIGLHDVLTARDASGRTIGYAARAGDVLAQLYVEPIAFRGGIGGALLAAMRARSATPLTLWCFSHNKRALAFYARHGGVVIDRETGDANEERLPALRLLLA